MTSPGTSGSQPGRRPGPLRVDRVGIVILLLATVIGLWMGLAGPDSSPVAPGGPPVSLLGVLVSGVGGSIGP